MLSNQIRLAQIESDYIRSDQIKPDQTILYQVRLLLSDPTKPDQIRLVQVGRALMRLGTISLELVWDILLNHEISVRNHKNMIRSSQIRSDPIRSSEHLLV